MNNMLTLDEVKTFLEVDHAAIENYLKAGKLHAYKIGGTFIRFRKEEVLNLRQELPKKKAGKKSLLALAADFWLFNNFYIISLAIVAALALLALKF